MNDSLMGCLGVIVGAILGFGLVFFIIAVALTLARAT